MNGERRGFNPEDGFATPSMPEVQGTVALESQKKLEELIERFSGSSKFKRKQLEDGGEEIISPEGEKFFVRQIENPHDPAVEKVYSLLVVEFGEDGIEPIDWVRHAIEDKISTYHVLEDEDKEVVSVANIRYLELDKKEEAPQEAMLYEAFIHSNPNIKTTGATSRELFSSCLRYALSESTNRGQVFKGFIGEMVTSVELFMNRLGHKRTYFEDIDGNVHEVPYFYPPCEFDSETGEPVLPEGKEHLMFSFADGRQDVSIDELIMIVDTLYQKEYVASLEDYNNQEAYGRAVVFAENILSGLRTAVSQAKDDRIFFMSARERKQKIKELSAQGKELTEVVTEDDLKGS